IPCIQIIGWAVIIIGLIYFWIYISTKAYMHVHKITFVHAFVIMLITLFIRFGVMIYVLDFLSVLLGLPDIFKTL
ncbi:MAG: hypothetical protein ABID61_03970, partial [Candidatus Micrarchaeota archaeon]